MTDITIPAEALEAAARAICAANKWGEPCAEPCTDCVPEARAALLAGLKAWPGMSQHGEDVLGPACIILPLTQDDEK